MQLFNDFHKAFHRVIYTLMLYNLRAVGVRGILYNVIKNMYVKKTSVIKQRHVFLKCSLQKYM